MFRLKIEDSLLEQIAKLATESGKQITEVANFALLKGLAAVQAELGGSEELEQKVRELLPKHGNLYICHSLSVSGRVVRAAREKWADEFIQDHWEEMEDVQLAEYVGRRASWITYRRHELGLDRRELFLTAERGAAAKIDQHALARALHDEGLTLEDFIERHRLNISKERLCQIADDKGVNTKPAARTASWHAHYHGCPELADAEKFKVLFQEAGSLGVLSERLKLTTGVIRSIGRRHGLEWLWKRKAAQIVEHICSNCRAAFRRRIYESNVGRNSKQTLFFCSKSCHGQYFGKTEGFGSPERKRAH
ncbi:MAG: hypothetical protein HYT48_02305 [Candidatus Vogelbacteria bacterium]|nr:hypothetical protein [Candidatus Vogelbacteria bacterium]